MGLEGVELIMALEEYFGVEIEDNEAEYLTTPRLVGDLIFTKIQKSDEYFCQSQRAFYALRNVFIKTFNLKRHQVKLDTPFRDYIPKAEEKEVWLRLKKAIRARIWPKFTRPSWLSYTLWGISFVVFLIATIWVSTWSSNNAGFAILMGILSAIGFAIISTKLTVSYKICIPTSLITMRDLIPYVITSDTISWTREHVSDSIKNLILEQFGIPEEHYTEDSKFIDDFGMD
ncbi:MAG: hypothetical protein OEM02_00100 [Desulfobulbaceae bacterium]|nr:hypothetical protein [Desulfobulbaceae bacterium]